MEKKIVKREFITNAANEAYGVLILIGIVENYIIDAFEVQKVESLFVIRQLKSILFGQNSPFYLY